MPALILYLLKFSISIAIVYLFYQLVLRRLTFYAWNRLYLFGYCLLSFAIPFINISPLTQQHYFDNTQLIRFIPVIENFTAASSVPPIVKHDVAENYSINGWQIFYAILIIGSIIMLVRLIMQLISLQKIKKSATIIHNEEAVIYNVDKNITPFSFGNAIYINQDMHSEKELQEIILHEYVHVKQKHTADIILSELICIINWYNPFAWLIRHAIRQNLEFIADNKVLLHGTDKRSYQYHLIKVVGSPEYRIANNFNFSSLKKRIAMMNKIKSAKLHLLRFLFVLPLLAVLLLAFRNKYADIFKKKFSICNIQGVVIDAQTDKPLADVKIRETISGAEATTNKYGFYSLQINTGKDSLNLKFDLKKNGYEDGNYRYNYAGNYPGFINVLGMFDTAIQHLHTAVMFMPGGKTLTIDPTADDVSKLFKEITATNNSWNDFLKFNNSHPDLTFYSTEDNKEHIVISKDGSVEKYGYPGSATIEDMERKYGSLPQMMKTSEPDKHAYYHEQWRKISQQAEKVFKTDDPNVKEIIFPGDSRVIVILKDGGKPKFYDMDNAVPEERPVFEKLYGSLDGIVPPANNFANGAHNDARYKDWRISGIEFFGFNKIDFDKDNSLTHFIGQGILKINNDAKALIIYNNKEYDPALFKQQFSNTKFGDVFIYENEGAFNKFGEKGKHGVIVINDKSSALTITSPVISVSKKDTVPLSSSQKQISYSLHRDDGMDKEHKDFFKRNVNIVLLHWTTKNELQIYRVNGKIEMINLNNDNDVQQAVAKYGKLPQAAGSYKDDAGIALSKNTKQITFDVKRHMDSVLFIVDDKEVDSSILSKLNAIDIESIAVLKDSSAINQYGTRASHGVIIITTKKTLEKNKPAMNKKDPDVSFASTDKSEYKIQTSLIDLLQEYINDPQTIHKLVPTNVGFENAELSKLIDDYNKLQRQRETDLRISNENDISIKEIDSRLKEDRAKINNVLKDIRQDLEVKINKS